jgi:hypothetical protein
LEVDGIVQFSEDEKIWVVVIDWNQIRQVEQLARLYPFCQEAPEWDFLANHHIYHHELVLSLTKGNERIGQNIATA